MHITGNRFLVNFGTAKAIFHFENETVLTFTITEKDGKKVYIVQSVSIQMTEIRPQLFMVNWKEKEDTIVIQVHDYKNSKIYSNWISPGEDCKNLQGTLTQLLPITVQTIIKATVEDCWKLWITPADIIRFNNPSEDWHTAHVEIDLIEGGNFFYRMEAKDRSAGFDFKGRYDKVITHKLIDYTGADGRKASNTFTSNGDYTVITEIFEPETTTPLDMQSDFCQAILDNFKKYAEKN